MQNVSNPNLDEFEILEDGLEDGIETTKRLRLRYDFLHPSHVVMSLALRHSKRTRCTSSATRMAGGDFPADYPLGKWLEFKRPGNPCSPHSTLAMATFQAMVLDDKSRSGSKIFYFKASKVHLLVHKPGNRGCFT